MTMGTSPELAQTLCNVCGTMVPVEEVWCIWRDSGVVAGPWTTQCGEEFWFSIDDDPESQRMVWCCYCGKLLHVEREAA